MRRNRTAVRAVFMCLLVLTSAFPAFAQPPGPRPTPAHGPHPGGAHVGVGVYYGPYAGPYFYSPWLYAGFWWGPPYWYGYPYYYGAVGANVKVQVQPNNAEVYVDGHYAGVVDQFDGVFQSLLVEPGGREITIYLEGYKSIVQHLYLSVGSTYKVKGVMEKLAPGEPGDPRPAAAPSSAPSPPEPPPPAVSQAYPSAQAPRVQDTPPPSGDPRFGQVAIRAQPADADVFIDGEAWKGVPGADRLIVHLPAGMHRIEIRKDGFDPFVTAVDVRRGEVTVLNVSLARM